MADASAVGANSAPPSPGYLRTNPPPIFRRGTNPGSLREPPRRPVSHASRSALLAGEARGGRLVLSVCRTRMTLEPCLTSLGGLVFRPSSLRFVARVLLGCFFDLDKVDGGIGNELGGSARRIDSGRSVGRGVSGDNAAFGLASSSTRPFSIPLFFDVGDVFGWSASMIPLRLADFAWELRSASRSLRFCFACASRLLYVRITQKQTCQEHYTSR